MASTTLIPTKLKLGQWVNAGPQLKLDTDTLVALIVVAGAGAPNITSSGVQFVSDVLGTNAELTYSGYTRQTLGGVTVAFDGTTNTLVDFSFANITWVQNSNDPGTGRYLVFADTTIGASDASHPVIAIADPGQTFSAASGALTFSCPTGGLIQF